MNPDPTPLIDIAVATIKENADELTALDQAIGDGDHGINMRRGFSALEASRAELGDMPLGAALQKAGMTLVMTIGGASGPLYGSLLMGLGKALPADPDAAAIARAVEQGVAAVKRRGKADVGAKTLLDVLIPMAEALRAGADQGVDSSTLLAQLALTAEQGLEATRPMQATKGRASFLGERSIGHLDPGAASSCLLIKAICAQLETQT